MTHQDVVDTVAAGAALTSPAWLPALHTVSEVAALLFPILGGIWFAVQIYIRIHEYYRSHWGPKEK